MPVAARAAYDIFAERYDHWHWQEFWHRNEWPHVKRMVEAASRQVAILDIGVGTGFYLNLLRSETRCLCGIDISFNMLKAAKRRLETSAHLVQADALHIPFPRASFQVILLNRVASHVPNLNALVSELARVLTSEGRVVVSDLAPEHAYQCTEFEAPHNRVLVETYKHSVQDWKRAAESNGLSATQSHMVTSHNLTWLPDSGFRSIDRDRNMPIAFVMALDLIRQRRVGNT